MALRTPRPLCIVALALLLCACAPRAEVAAPAPAPAAGAATPTLPTTGPLAPDASCQVASDCTVKNVGNCCGHFPACVNADAVVDPDAVRAQCEREGMASVCGWAEIRSCDCVDNRCQAVGGSGALPVER